MALQSLGRIPAVTFCLIAAMRHKLAAIDRQGFFMIKFIGKQLVIVPVVILGLTLTSASAPQGNYSRFALQTPTAFEEAPTSFVFALGPSHDLFGIKIQNMASGHVEVHRVSAASNYQQFVLHTGTPIPDPSDFMYAIRPDNGDLYLLKVNNTGSGHFEVHVLSAASNYQTFVVHAVTPVKEDPSNFTFLVAAGGDVVLVKIRNTNSQRTEIHILSASSGYQSFVLQTGTPIEEAPDSFRFAIDPNRRIYAVKIQNTHSHTTEVHVLSPPNYNSFQLQTGTILAEEPGNFTYGFDENRNLYAIKIRNTSSGKTEMHVVIASPPQPPPGPSQNVWCIYVMFNGTIWKTHTYHGSRSGADVEGVKDVQNDGGDTYTVQHGSCPGGG